MKTILFRHLAVGCGLFFALGCGAEPAAAPAPGGAGSSAASSSGAPDQASAGTGQSATGGSLASGGVGQAGTASATAGSADAGTGGAAGAGGVGTSGAGGAGGAVSNDGWVKIFNGVDLTGWYPLIHKSAYKEDPYSTFRVDPANQVLKVTYQDYPASNFDERCGLLYYDKFLTNYRVRLTYRFLEPQAQNPVGWGKNNSGLMIFGLDPAKVTGDPMFPPLIEIQLLGSPSSGGSTNGNLCEPGGMKMTKSTGGCGDNHTNVAAPPAAEWVTVEAEVHVDGDTKVYQHPDMTTSLLTMSGPIYQGQPVTGGYLSIQSESQPLEFKDIELKELP